MMLGHSSPISEADHRSWFARTKSNSSCIYMIAYLETGAVDGNGPIPLDVGLIRVTEIDPVAGTACVGADVFESQRGKGYGTLCFNAACAVARDAGATKHLYLWVFCDNFVARRIYEKAGFTIDPDTPVQTFIRRGVPSVYVRMVKDLP